MHIINITYKVTIDQVEEHLETHIDYLKEQYALGNFMASGRKNPRNGGVILSNAGSIEEVQSIIEKDPFYQHDLATFELIEFIPTMTSKELEFLKTN